MIVRLRISSSSNNTPEIKNIFFYKKRLILVYIRVFSRTPYIRGRAYLIGIFQPFNGALRLETTSLYASLKSLENPRTNPRPTRPSPPSNTRELTCVLSPKFKRVSLNETPEFPFWGFNIL